ncbi:MAG TPA: TM2 domain-containing protein [Termitinemataceae bacterium]|nr:TM2 domain-containing protein [Termitinemataceae bacterium]
MYNLFIAYLLWFLSGFGALGFHRFYLGKIPTGLLWMCTGGLGMVGAIYDFFTLPVQVVKANMKLALQERQGSYPGPGGYTNGGWRYAEDGEARIVKKESLERVILRVAKANKGLATASEVALEADIPLEEAKAALEKLVDKGFAELRVKNNGTLVYAFPDLMDSKASYEDLSF